MMGTTRYWSLLCACVALSLFGSAGCRDCSGCGADAIPGMDAAARGGGRGGPVAKLSRNQEVLFVGGLMSELYDELSANLENEINAALERAARSLNVHIDLPGDRSIDIAIGDAIADALPRVELPIEPGRFISFYTQMRYFEAEGIAYRNVSLVSPSFDTSESVEHNAAAILELLRGTHKQVIIVSHSKGGLDTLEALLGAPELWGNKVIGWVALQAPFHGSPLADPAPSAIHDMLSRVVGGNGQAIDDLKTTTRALYMDANKERIANLTARIPIISAYTTYEASGTITDFASTFARGIFDSGLVSEISEIVISSYRATPRDIPRVIGASTTAAIRLISDRVANARSSAVGTIGIMTLTNVYLSDVLNLPNDGLVPRDSTALQGTIHRELDVGDHASPVMDVDPLKNFWTAEHRNRVTGELITEVRSLARDAAR